MAGDRKEGELYDAYYFATGCGRPYQRDAEWLGFFGTIADRIVSDIGPKTVLDAGCAMGFLVEALRERGVEAYGIDISEYAIERAHESVRDYCWVGSVTEPFPQSYDLIVCIEVLEHLPAEKAQAAVANLCKHTDDILFSSTPFDYKEATHFNVQPPEYWAEAFARHGFLRDLDFDSSIISPWAFRSRRRQESIPRVVREYERRYWSLWRETVDLRDMAVEMRAELAKQSQRADAAEARPLAAFQNEQREARRAREANQHLQAVLSSRSWRFMLGLQSLRLRLIPLGSTRDRVFHALIDGIGVSRSGASEAPELTRGGEGVHISRLPGNSAATTKSSPRASARDDTRRLRVALYALDPVEAACPHLRIAGPAMHPDSGIELLVGAGWENGALTLNLPNEADVVLIQRDFPRFEAEFANLLDWARSAGKPVAYELDDLLTELPNDHPEKQYYDEARPQMAAAMAEADAVVVSTEAIERYVHQFNSRTWVLPNYLDDRLWNLREPEVADPRNIVLGYMGGRTQTHIPDLELIVPVLIHLLESYPDKLRLRFWGTFPPDLKDHPKVEVHTETYADYASFASYFSQQQCDIFLAPLIENQFNNSKSWIKFLEYSAIGIAGVYSRLTPYGSVLTQGVSGFLASSTKEWEKYLRVLIEQPDRRQSMARSALNLVRRHFLLSNHAHRWGLVYRAIYSAATYNRGFSPSKPIGRLRPHGLSSWRAGLRAAQRTETGAETMASTTSAKPPSAPRRLRRLIGRGRIVLRREGIAAFLRAAIRYLRTLLAGTRRVGWDRTVPGPGGVRVRKVGGRQLGEGVVPVVSIVIPVLNGLTYVRECLQSVFDSQVGLSYEVIVVDQGSRDGTLEYLRRLAHADPRVTLLENASNVGFGPAINQAVAEAQGEFIALLNSDVIVTPAWLDKLVQPLREDPELAITSPVTNYVGEGPQIDPDAQLVVPDTAWEYAREISGRDEIEQVVDRLVFFGVVVRRKVFDLLGGLAPVFGIGNYEDEDFCLRVRMAGMKLAIVRSAFIYHHGSRTFRGQNIDHTALMLRNEKTYFDRVATFATHRPFLSSGAKPKERPSVSVIMRTKDRPQLLAQALTSLANQTASDFEVVVINDGGEEVDWIVSDFSPHLEIRQVRHDPSIGRAAALNSGLAKARGEWITYLDDDDITYPTHLEHLMGAVGNNRGYEVAYTDVNKALCWSTGGWDRVIKRARFRQGAVDLEDLLVENSIPIMSLMHSAACVTRVGGFDDDLPIFEDWDFIIRLSQAYEFRHVPRISCEYRFRFGDEGEDTTLHSRELALQTMERIHSRYPTTNKRTQDLRAIAVDATGQIIEEMRDINAMEGSEIERRLLVTARLGGFADISRVASPI